MITVPEAEVNSRLSALLDSVAAGGHVLITRDGKPLARLVSAQVPGQPGTAQAVETLRRLRGALSLSGLSWKELRDEGRA
jgi:prevent-host-death family protein